MIGYSCRKRIEFFPQEMKLLKVVFQYQWCKVYSLLNLWGYLDYINIHLTFNNLLLQGLRGQQILEKIEQGARLDKPDLCPPGVYEIMLKCWRYE